MLDVLAPLSLAYLLPLCLVGLLIFLLLAELSIGYLLQLQDQITAEISRDSPGRLTARVVFPRGLITGCNVRFAE